MSVEPGSPDGRLASIVVMAVSGAVMLAGAGVTIYGAAAGQRGDADMRGVYMAPGGLTIGVGTAALIGGFVGFVQSRTTVDVRSGGPVARAPRYWLGEL